MSRYAPKGASKGALTYFWLVYPNNIYTAFDYNDSKVIAEAGTLAELRDKCLFLGYRPSGLTEQKEPKL